MGFVYNRVHAAFKKREIYTIILYVVYLGEAMRLFLMGILLIQQFLLGQPILTEQFLLRQPIQQAFETGDFSSVRAVCQESVSVNFDPPFSMNGYFHRDKLIDLFSRQLADYTINNLEWLTRQVEEKFAIQSLNLILKDNRLEKLVYYKFIFFMTKDKTWKLYYLKGLKI